VFGINPSEFLVLLAVAAVVLGPERLPEYAQQLARLVRELRRMAQGASAQVRDELGPEFDDIDWRKLDPRQYDPRRIVRDALSDVWDDDDPLGLRATKSALADDFNWNGEKPVSPGAPTAQPAAANGSSGSNGSPAANGGSNGTAARAADSEASEPSPFFDPDAT
jgi:sec-independent protein translocase protein TatB